MVIGCCVLAAVIAAGLFQLGVAAIAMSRALNHTWADSGDRGA